MNHDMSRRLRWQHAILCGTLLASTQGQELPDPLWRFDSGQLGSSLVPLQPRSAPIAARTGPAVFWGLNHSTGINYFGTKTRELMRLPGRLPGDPTWWMYRNYQQCMGSGGSPWIVVDMYRGNDANRALLQGSRAVLSPGQPLAGPAIPLGSIMASLNGMVGQSDTFAIADVYLDQAGQRRAFRPIDDAGTRGQHVRVHLESHVRLGDPQPVEQGRVLLGSQHVDRNRIGRRVTSECGRERLERCDMNAGEM